MSTIEQIKAMSNTVMPEWAKKNFEILQSLTPEQKHNFEVVERKAMNYYQIMQSFLYDEVSKWDSSIWNEKCRLYDEAMAEYQTLRAELGLTNTAKEK